MLELNEAYKGAVQQALYDMRLARLKLYAYPDRPNNPYFRLTVPTRRPDLWMLIAEGCGSTTGSSFYLETSYASASTLARRLLKAGAAGLVRTKLEVLLAWADTTTAERVELIPFVEWAWSTKILTLQKRPARGRTPRQPR